MVVFSFVVISLSFSTDFDSELGYGAALTGRAGWALAGTTQACAHRRSPTGCGTSANLLTVFRVQILQRFLFDLKLSAPGPRARFGFAPTPFTGHFVRPFPFDVYDARHVEELPAWPVRSPLGNLSFPAPFLRLPVPTIGIGNDRSSSEDRLPRACLSPFGILPRDQILQRDHTLLSVALRLLILFHDSEPVISNRRTRVGRSRLILERSRLAGRLASKGHIGV